MARKNKKETNSAVDALVDVAVAAAKAAFGGGSSTFNSKKATSTEKAEEAKSREEDMKEIVKEIAGRMGFAFEKAQIRADGSDKFVLQLRGCALVDKGIEYEIFKNSLVSGLSFTSSNVKDTIEVKGPHEVVSDAFGERLAALNKDESKEPDVDSMFHSNRKYFSLEGENGVLFHGDKDTGTVLTHDELITMFSNEVYAITRGEGIECGEKGNYSGSKKPSITSPANAGFADDIDLESVDDPYGYGWY